MEGLAWVKTKYANQSDDWPDIEFHFVAGTPVTDGGTAIRFNNGIKNSTWDAYYKPILHRDTWQVIPMLLRPLSTGTIRLASTDPYAKPLIDPQYFSNVQDLNVIIEGTKIGLALAKTEAFQKLGTKFYDAPFPGCEGYKLWTDDYWGCFIRHYSSTIYHPAGTCKMGPSSDPTAVVDPQLRVYGIKGLRVADCSIMPFVVSGNTNAPTVQIKFLNNFPVYFGNLVTFDSIWYFQIMIGEKASDLIKSDWPTAKINRRKNAENQTAVK